MEIKPGCKQTMVGLIPEDWKILSLAEAAIVIDSLHRTPRFSEDGYPMVRVADIETGNLCLSGALMVSETIFEEFTKKYKPKRGDIVLSRVGSYGVSSFVETDEKFCMGQNTVVIQSKLPPRFLYYALNSYSIKRQIEDGSYGSGYRSLSLTNINRLRICLPPTKAEQEAIAEALSDADALIESLEQLIAKKRKIKQGAMQELLTGKRRLPGFGKKPGYKKTEVGVIPEDWEAPELGTIMKLMQLGGNYKNSERESSWPLIKMGNLGRGNIKLDKLEFIDPSNPPIVRDKLRKDDVLLNTRNTLDLVGKVAMWRNELPEAYFNSNIMRMEFDEEKVSSNNFMNNILNTQDSLKRLREIAIGTTSVAAIYSRDLVKIRVTLPPKAEQTAIAAVLSDMDAEITALETKLAKSRQVKQGMMQELLTGRIRLI